MKSRMDRYYHSQSGETTSRISKNKSFYDRNYNGDYDFKSYSNVEGVADINRDNQIDLKKLQNLLKKREEERQSEIPHLVKRNVVERNVEFEEEKNHDINEVLSQAKTEKKDDYKTRNLSDTSYNVLRNININKVNEEDKELQDLINTITSTKFLNKLDDKDLSLDMLNLKSDNNTNIVNSEDVKEAIKNQSSSYENKTDENLSEIDKSFYTSSLGFTSDDFEQLRDIKDSIKTNNKLIKFLVFVLIIAIIAGIVFLIYNLRG